MKPNMYKLVENCVSKGVDYGYTRAHKHTDNPSDFAIKTEILEAIMLEFSEWFIFENECE